MRQSRINMGCFLLVFSRTLTLSNRHSVNINSLSIPNLINSSNLFISFFLVYMSPSMRSVHSRNMMSWNSYFKETFTLLAFNNFLAFETTGLIDFSLLIGNQLITYISGLLAVFNLWYRAARTQTFIFLVIVGFNAFVSCFELFL